MAINFKLIPEIDLTIRFMGFRDNKATYKTLDDTTVRLEPVEERKFNNLTVKGALMKLVELVTLD